MFRIRLRFRSKGSVPLHCRHRGSTLVELMVTVALMAIAVTLALPSYKNMTEKRQVTNGAEQLAAFINTAQGVAQRNNRMVTLSYQRTDDDQWCMGMAEDDTICNCKTAPAACEIGSQSFVIDNSFAGNAALMHSLSSESSAYYIDPVRGLFLPCQVVDGDAGTCVPIAYAALADAGDPLDIEIRSPSGDFRLSLLVNNTGRVTLCSMDGHDVPGYSPCEGGEG